MANDRQNPEITSTPPIGLDALPKTRKISSSEVQGMLFPFTQGSYMHPGWEYWRTDSVSQMPIFRWNQEFGEEPEPPFEYMRPKTKSQGEE